MFLVLNIILQQNSLRATIEHNGLDAKDYPPVHIHIVKGTEDVTIVIADRGGKFLKIF